MATNATPYELKVFCSYSHQDDDFLQALQRHLHPLQNHCSLTVWSDKDILPGQPISKSINQHLSEADICIFLFSSYFLASEPCMEEWDIAASLAQTNPRLVRIPIIISPCSWESFLDNDDILALPTDATPISSFPNAENGWLDVSRGITRVVNSLKLLFSPKEEFQTLVDETLFVSNGRRTLSETFVFPRLLRYKDQPGSAYAREEVVKNEDALLAFNLAIIHGEEMSGKTALARRLYLHLVSTQQPTLLVDMSEIGRTINQRIFRRFFSEQFHGDYALWEKLAKKTIILDNLSSSSRMLQLIEYSRQFFDNIIVFSKTDTFLSYFQDEERLSDFVQLKIDQLTYESQEQVIRKWMISTTENNEITDGTVDRLEDLVNSVIISNKIVPRYPFYVLSIMQTQEAFMPSDLDITSYGHCYYALIVANLVKSGISKSGGEIESCLNFSERLAYWLYSRAPDTEVDFREFIEEYKKEYVITDATLNRITGREYGIVSQDGSFRTFFMFLFFLGRYFAKNRDETSNLVESICQKIHHNNNDMILLFTIHHTNDDSVIDEVILRTMCTLEYLEPATLDAEESDRFFAIVQRLPTKLVGRHQVEDERKARRRFSDKIQREISEQDLTSSGEGNDNTRNDFDKKGEEMYRVLRSNQVLGQILRNKFGSLKRIRISEIIETVSDSGLKMVNALLNETEIEEKSRALAAKFPEFGQKKVEGMLRMASFLWTIANIELIVHATNVPEVRQAMEEVVEKKDTPAYDLIGYFSLLDGSEKLTQGLLRQLRSLWKKHDNFFMRQVIALRTLGYMNTHRSDIRLEQAVCALLGVSHRQHR